MRWGGRVEMLRHERLDSRELYYRLSTGPIWLRTFSEDWTLTPLKSTSEKPDSTHIQVERVLRLNSIYLEKLVEPWLKKRAGQDLIQACEGLSEQPQA